MPSAEYDPRVLLPSSEHRYVEVSCAGLDPRSAARPELERTLRAWGAARADFTPVPPEAPSALLEFRTNAEAERFCTARDGSSVHGVALRMRMVCPDVRRRILDYEQAAPGSTLVVGGFPRDCARREAAHIFRRFDGYLGARQSDAAGRFIFYFRDIAAAAAASLNTIGYTFHDERGTYRLYTAY